MSVARDRSRTAILSPALERVIGVEGAGCVGEIRGVTEFETPPGLILGSRSGTWFRFSPEKPERAPWR
jgi:hypothetical protein